MKYVLLTTLKNRLFGMGPRTALSIDRDFDQAAECECLDFDTRMFIARQTPFFQNRNVSQLYVEVRPDAPHQ